LSTQDGGGGGRDIKGLGVGVRGVLRSWGVADQFKSKGK
jgi:hypothetical protein